MAVITQDNLRTYLNFLSGAVGSTVTDMNGRVWTSAQFAARRGYDVPTITFIPAFTMTCSVGGPREFSAGEEFTLDAATINEQTTC